MTPAQTTHKTLADLFAYEAIEEQNSDQTQVATKGSAEKSTEISKNALVLLITISKRIGKPGIADLYREAQLSGYHGHKARTELDKSRLVKFTRMPSKKKGPDPLVPEITASGWDILKTHGIEKTSVPGSGSVRHKQAQMAIKEYCKRTYPDASFNIEGWLVNTLIDGLLTNSDGTRIAFEVAITTHHQLNNIRKDLRYGCFGVVVVCLDNNTKEKMQKEVQTHLSKKDQTRVSVKLLKEFM